MRHEGCLSPGAYYANMKAFYDYLKATVCQRSEEFLIVAANLLLSIEQIP